VIRLSGHRRLAAIWRGIDPLVWLIRTRHDPRVSDQAEALVAEHRELLAALRAGPDAAEAAARYHVVRGLDRPPRAWGPPLDGRAATPQTESPAPGPRDRAGSGR
jgi:DNA-binding GntR family transcriptional regulator